MTEQITKRTVDGEDHITVHRFIDYSREEYYDDNTLMRVLQALLEAGVDCATARDAMNILLDRGILFRERKP